MKRMASLPALEASSPARHLYALALHSGGIGQSGRLKNAAPAHPQRRWSRRRSCMYRGGGRRLRLGVQLPLSKDKNLAIMTDLSARLHALQHPQGGDGAGGGCSDSHM